MERRKSDETKIFNHDKTRGKWESPSDFLFACVGNGFKIDAMLVLPLLIFVECGIYTPIYYLAALAVCAVPLILLQSFLGQFSSTGFLSAFRIVGSFTGVTYFSLVINFAALIIYGVFSAFPLLYIFNDLVGLGISSATDNLTQTETTTSAFKDKSEFASVHGLLDLSDFNENDKVDYSGPLVVCLIIIWIIVTFIVRQPTELIGRLMRYSVMVFVFLMSICLLRFLFLPGAVSILMEAESLESGVLRTFPIIPLLAYSTLGPSWGSVVTMASFNNFRTNIFKFSWLIGLMQFGIVCGMTFLTMFLKTSADNPLLRDHPDWTNLLEYPSTLRSLGVSNIWSVFLFGMLTLGCLNLLVVQLLSFLTSIFDEFETIRDKKAYASFVIVALIVVLSSFFSSKFGILLCENLSRAILLGQIFMDLLLLFVMFYVYGLEHLQRDLKFMTSQTISPGFGKLMTLTPFFLGLQFLLGCMWGEDTSKWAIFILFQIVMYIVAILILFLFIIPICCSLTNYICNGGTWLVQKKHKESINWYPADPDDRQSYEELLSQNQSQPLSSIREIN